MEAVLIPAREILYALIVFSGITGQPGIHVTEIASGNDRKQCTQVAALMKREPVAGQVWMTARCRESVGV